MPEEIYMMTETSLDDAHTLSCEKHTKDCAGSRGKSLPEISRHRKDPAFWTVHTLPGNLYLKSAERALTSTWLSGQMMVSNGHRGETITEEDVGRTLVNTWPLEALCTERFRHVSLKFGMPRL